MGIHSNEGDHDGFLGLLFRRYAKLVGKYPLIFITISFLMSVALSVGILTVGLQIDTDPQRIWVPQNSDTALQQAYFDAAFDPFFRINQVIIVLDNVDPEDSSVSLSSSASSSSAASFSSILTQDDDDTPNSSDNSTAAGILRRDYLEAIYNLQTLLTNTAANNIEQTVLNDICYKPIVGKGCLVETPLDFFRSNITLIKELTPALIQDALSCRPILGATTIPCMSTIGVPVLPAVVLGDIHCPTSTIPGYNFSVCGGCGNAASAVMLTFLLQNTAETTSLAESWEHDVFLPLVSSFTYPGLKVSYMAERSISDELEVVDEQNQFVVVISYAAMFCYIAFALGKFPHPIASRSLLGLQGVIIVVFSVTSALGIAAYAGIHITMIVTEVVPFLILAIGVDNMFIITKAIDRRWWGPLGSPLGGTSSSSASAIKSMNNDYVPSSSSSATTTVTGLTITPVPIALTPRSTAATFLGTDIYQATIDAIAEVGPTITAAAICEVLAFAIGLTTMIPALQQFCAVAAMAVAIDYTLQLTWFLPAVILDAQRQEARRMDVFPCVRIRGPGVEYTRCSLGLRFCCTPSNDNDYPDDVTTETSSSGGDRHSTSSGQHLLDEEENHLAMANASASASRYGRKKFRSVMDIGLERGFAAGYKQSELSTDGGGMFSPRSPGESSSSVPSINNNTVTNGSSSSSSTSAHGNRGSTNLRKKGSGSIVGSPAFYAAYGQDDDNEDPSNSNAVPIKPSVKPLLNTDDLVYRESFDYNDEETNNYLYSAANSSEVSANHNSCTPRFWYFMNGGGFVRKFLANFYAPFLFHPLIRLLVILVWLGLIGVSFYGVTKLQLGLEQQLALPEGSYLKPYFDEQARLGEAGPPAYLVLQNVNYTHPNASSSIAGLATAIGGLTRYIVAPVYSWVSDFETWSSSDTRNYVNQHPELLCPPPLDPANATHASRVAQYVYDILIDSPCCQSAGYCGGQYSSDVKFIWGIPKAEHTLQNKYLQQYKDSLLYTSVPENNGNKNGDTTTVEGTASHPYRMTASVTVMSNGMVTESITKAGYGIQVQQTEGIVYQSTTRLTSTVTADTIKVIDDGGCDLSVGYLSHREVENALYTSMVYTDHSASSTLPAALKKGSKLSSSIPSLMRSRIEIPSHLSPLALPERIHQRLKLQRERLQSLVGNGINLQDLPVNVIPCHVMTSRLRTQHTPLRNQSDFIDSMQHTQQAVSQLQSSLPTVDLSIYGIQNYGNLNDGSSLNSSNYGYIGDDEHLTWLPPAPNVGSAFPYSLIYVYYDQYSYIRGVTVTLLAVSIATVILASFLVTAPSVAIITGLLITSSTVCLCGWVWLLNPHGVPDPFGSGPYGVDINAVSVVNIVAAVGLSVEFIIHMAAAYVRSANYIDIHDNHNIYKLSMNQPTTPSEASARALHALVHTGSSVITGITFTKLVGVAILGYAPSQLFRLYYFRMYLGIIIMGAFHGLALLPVLFATFGGIRSYCSKDHKATASSSSKRYGASNEPYAVLQE